MAMRAISLPVYSFNMRVLLSFFFGGSVAIGAVLIHQSLPPFGVALAIIATYFAIWWIGRYFEGRKFRFFAVVGWFVVIIKAGTFGVGRELLIQADSPGSALFNLGAIAALAAIFRAL